MSAKKILFSTLLLSAVRVSRLLSQFIVVPILSRLLNPEEYGLVALAMPVALFAMLLADAGIGMSLVRTPQNERTQWSTCFWLTIILGGALSLIVAALGPPAAALFDEPRLSPIIMTISLLVFAQAIHLIPVAALQQAQKFKTIAVIDILCTTVSLVTAVYMAYHGYGAWSLIGQQLAFFGLRVALVCWLTPFRPLWVFNWPLVREHILFGRNVLGNSIINYFSRTSDNWIVGKVLGAGVLGFYSMAFMFARLPIQIVTGPLQYVIYSQLARIKNNVKAVAATFLGTSRAVALVVLPGMGLVAAAHYAIFPLLLSEKWADAGRIFLYLAPAATLQCVVSLGETVIYALGRTDLQLRTSAEYTVIWLTTLILTVSAGIEAAAIGFTICTVAYQFRYLSVILKIIGLRFNEYLTIYKWPVIFTAAGILAYDITTAITPLNYWGQSFVAACIALVAIGLGFLVQKKPLLAELSQWNAPQPINAPELLETGIEPA